MRRAFSAILAALLLCSLGGCSKKPVERTFFAMDTVMTATAYGASDDDLAALEARVFELEALFSRTREDSDISRVNSSKGAAVTVSPDTLALLRLAEEYRVLTGGAFDVSVGSVMDAWGFTKGETAYRVPDSDELASLLPLTGEGVFSVEGEAVTLLKPGAVLDPGGIGKGYAGDAALSLLRERGVESAVAALGGNVCCLGAKPDGSPWRIAVRDPSDTDAYAGYLELTDTCAVTTGGYERGFTSDGVTYHHVIDPAAGYPAESGLLSVTVVCKSSARADILSTALFVLGEEKALALREELGGFELLLLTADGRAVITGGLSAAFTPAESSGYTLDPA